LEFWEAWALPPVGLCFAFAATETGEFWRTRRPTDRRSRFRLSLVRVLSSSASLRFTGFKSSSPPQGAGKPHSASQPLTVSIAGLRWLGPWTLRPSCATRQRAFCKVFSVQICRQFSMPSPTSHVIGHLLREAREHQKTSSDRLLSRGIRADSTTGPDVLPETLRRAATALWPHTGQA
jgi:hypothetical protein